MPRSCLEYVSRWSKLPLLPAPRNDKNVLMLEEKMVRDRHKAYTEYLVTGGKGRDCASPSDHLEIQRFCQQFSDAQSTSTLVNCILIERH